MPNAVGELQREERRVLRLENLKSGARITGILPNATVAVVDVRWIGSTAVELTYKAPNGQVANQLLYRDSEPALELVAAGVPWAFDSDGTFFRLGSEAHRIRLAYLFDPLLAVCTSLVEPLPHQITGVYEALLPRQPRDVVVLRPRDVAQRRAHAAEVELTRRVLLQRQLPHLRQHPPPRPPVVPDHRPKIARGHHVLLSR